MGDFLTIIVLIVCAIGALIMAMKAPNPYQILLEKLQESHHNYQAALKTLQKEKTSDARVAALEAGRLYIKVNETAKEKEIAFVRKWMGWGEPNFTEVTLQNDLQAYGAD